MADPQLLSAAICDPGNPVSLVNMLPVVIGKKLIAIAQGDLVRGLLQLDETRLKKELKVRGYRPTQTDNFIRTQLWAEWRYACRTGPPFAMQIDRITQGVITRELFYGFYLQSPLALSWVLCPPLSLELAIEEALQYGISELKGMFDLEDNGPRAGNLKIGAARVLGELAGILTPNGKSVKGKKKKAEAAKAEIKILTEADLEERKRLLAEKMARAAGDSSG